MYEIIFIILHSSFKQMSLVFVCSIIGILDFLMVLFVFLDLFVILQQTQLARKGWWVTYWIQ